MTKDEEQEIRVITLQNRINGESILYRLQIGWILQFRLGPSLFGTTVTLNTNAPKGDNQDEIFERHKYRELLWSHELNSTNTDESTLFVNVKLTLPGSFHYYINDDVKNGGYFIVDPELRIQKNISLPLNGLSVLTLLSKNLGPFSDWEKQLKVFATASYNVFHFTPVQVLGPSGSAYSLANQHNLNPNFKTNWSDLGQLMEKCRNEWGILSLCDIVLNHTSSQDSLWLTKDYRSSFNLKNSPHLRPAFVFDQMFASITEDIFSGKWIHVGIPEKKVETEQHLNIIKHLIYSQYLPPLRLAEYFQVNVDNYIQETESISLEDLKILQDPNYDRFGSKVNNNNICSREQALELNRRVYDWVQSQIDVGVENVLKGIRWERLDSTGPRISICSKEHPLISPYFTNGGADDVIMLHNGWVMNHDPISDLDFVHPSSHILLRRELIAWGDSVKLNYGKSPEDSPYLWNYMTKYVQRTAEIFDGLRLDNCHSTPLHVAEILLDAARRIKPNLYVIAELFTSSESSDNIFINRLGINSLVRENLTANDAHELGRLLHRFGGGERPVGSFSQYALRPLVPSIAHALFYDQTHDNPSSLQKRSVYDLVPTAALLSLSSCAIGSTRGVDELIPHHINVVEEKRRFNPNLESNTGLLPLRHILNKLHTSLEKDGFDELFVDQVSDDVLALTRHHSKSHEFYLLIARTSFTTPNSLNPSLIRSLEVEGVVLEVCLQASTEVSFSKTSFEKDERIINGLENVNIRIQEHSSESSFASWTQKATNSSILCQLPPGSFILLKLRLLPVHLEYIERLAVSFSLNTESFTLVDLNYILFRCAQEDEAETYALENYGPLPYGGLSSLIHILNTIRSLNDTGNWLPSNLRQGNWLLDYIVQRLTSNGKTKKLGDFLEDKFSTLKEIPRYYIPKYFDILLRQVVKDCMNRVWFLMSDFVKNGSEFVKCLSIGSVISCGIVKSAPLFQHPESVSLSAGLPHFSAGYMRNWGRDTFISLRGFLLLPGRLSEAENLILSFGACLRHGLIPNLLDRGHNARYNCRDAVWWWLQSIKDLCILTNSTNFLSTVVHRVYPRVEVPLHCLIYDAIQTHFKGLVFREENAGKSIDEYMRNEGFNNIIGVDLKTGFVFGGNAYNCGTWMDKMGSSAKAGNIGIPSTPRDGSAIEIIGLSYSVLSWLSNLNSEDFPYVSVTNDSIKMTFEQWANKIRENFDKYYYIGEIDSEEERNPQFVHKRKIYKDSLNSSSIWTDYQLRPNFPIAMTLAPELFDRCHAWKALQSVKRFLLGPLGLSTLDPDDWNYRGVYDNNNDSCDPSVAFGANYHQGPEWVWPIAYFLRAYLIFSKNKEEAKAFVSSVLSAHYAEIVSSKWRGIPELTNAKGAFCNDSNPIQAWSMACLLEVLYDLKDI